jgi:hypothetical protein
MEGIYELWGKVGVGGGREGRNRFLVKMAWAIEGTCTLHRSKVQMLRVCSVVSTRIQPDAILGLAQAMARQGLLTRLGRRFLEVGCG